MTTKAIPKASRYSLGKRFIRAMKRDRWLYLIMLLPFVYYSCTILKRKPAYAPFVRYPGRLPHPPYPDPRTAADSFSTQNGLARGEERTPPCGIGKITACWHVSFPGAEDMQPFDTDAPEDITARYPRFSVTIRYEAETNLPASAGLALPGVLRRGCGWTVRKRASGSPLPIFSP